MCVIFCVWYSGYTAPIGLWEYWKLGHFLCVRMHIIQVVYRTLIYCTQNIFPTCICIFCYGFVIRCYNNNNNNTCGPCADRTTERTLNGNVLNIMFYVYLSLAGVHFYILNNIIWFIYIALYASEYTVDKEYFYYKLCTAE